MYQYKNDIHSIIVGTTLNRREIDISEWPEKLGVYITCNEFHGYLKEPKFFAVPADFFYVNLKEGRTIEEIIEISEYLYDMYSCIFCIRENK